MPRKRKTKVASRAKPQLPSDSEEVDMAEEERKAKLEAFLKDFDIQVETKVAEMRSMCNSMVSAIRRAASMYTVKLPKGMKSMKQVDYFAQNARAPAEKVIAEFSKTVDEMVSKSLQMNMSAKAASSSADTTEDSSSQATSESESECNETSTRPVRSTRKATGARKKKGATTAKKTSARKRTRAALQETPANQDNIRESGFQTPANTISITAMNTPFITPKFDTSSKLMPSSIRRAKKGELLVSLSGSPVEAKNSPQESKRSSTEPQSVEQIAGNLIDDMDKRNILMLQETLSRMLKEKSQPVQ